MTRNALKMANVVRHEDYHTLIDVSLLMTMPDCEFLKYRNVGKVTLEAINELKKGWTVNVSPNLLFWLKTTDFGLKVLP